MLRNSPHHENKDISKFGNMQHLFSYLENIRDSVKFLPFVELKTRAKSVESYSHPKSIAGNHR